MGQHTTYGLIYHIKNDMHVNITHTRRHNTYVSIYHTWANLSHEKNDMHVNKTHTQ